MRRTLSLLALIALAAAACAVGQGPPGCHDDSECLAPGVCRAGACIGFTTDEAGGGGAGGGA